MTHLFIQPTDVLVFRDGRPFDAGSDHLASGVFPPPPPTLYGAIRSALLAQEGADFATPDFGLTGTATEVLGKVNKLGALRIADVSLGRATSDSAAERLYAPPLDLLARKTSAADAHGDPAYLMTVPQAHPGMQSNLPEGMLLLGPASPHRIGTFYEGMGECLLTEKGFASVLSGTTPEAFTKSLVARKSVFEVERRTSVALRAAASKDFTSTAQEGNLFTVEFIRMHHRHGLVVTVDGDDGLLPDTGMLRLGGEGRPASFSKVSLEPPDSNDIVAERAAIEAQREALVAEVARTGRVKMVLTTLAPFAHGWRPDGFGDDLRGTLGDAPARLVSAAVARPATLGGWDIHHNCPYPARPAAPAGAVYFFQLDAPSDADALFARIDGNSLFSPDSDEAKKGLGVVRLGCW